MDLLRIAFAALVLLSHAPEITDGNPSRELCWRLTHAITFGGVGVNGFFLLSGFLIVKSWQVSPNLSIYLRKRLLRIVPGYIVAVALSTVVLGYFAPSAPGFFTHLNRHFWTSILFLSFPVTPDVCPGLHYHLVNGAMYTINYEFRCYLLVALLGVCGWLRRSVWLAATFLVLVLDTARTLDKLPAWSKHFLLLGNPDYVFRFTLAFCVGGCFFLFRDRIRFQPMFAVIAALILMLAVRKPWYFETLLILCGGYLLFYLCSREFRWLDRLPKFPDISYGLYLYGWPVEMLLIWYLHLSPWITFLLALAACVSLGLLSWHFVERPMLQLKPRPSAPLPD